jgi:hypothetical protein
MRTIFWRFAYDETKLQLILSESKLVFPNFTQWPLSKNTEDKVLLDIKVGHYILLANFNLNTNTGAVRGVGKIISKEDTGFVVEWRKPVPFWNLSPNVQGGIQQWRNEGVFCFDATPVKHYKLAPLTEKLFKK